MEPNEVEYKQKYVFLAEWYNATAEITKSFLLSFYPSDQTLELYDIQYRRLFLRRTRVEGITLKSLYRGALVTIFSRHIRIVEYANQSTEKLFVGGLQKIFFIVKPDGISHVGDIISRLEKIGFNLTRVKMGLLTTNAVNEIFGVNADQSSPTHAGIAYLAGYSDVVNALCEGPCVGVEAIGEQGRSRWLETVGPADPILAKIEAPCSLRASYGTDAVRNAIHARIDSSSMEREAEFWFANKNPETMVVSPPCQLAGSTCCVIKPHAIQESLVGDILNFIDKNGFQITAMGMFNLDRTSAEEFYDVYKGVLPEYSSMITQLASGPCIALEIVDSKNPPKSPISFRDLCGPTDPITAKKFRPESIRAKFGTSTVLNAVHCTDLPEDAKLEVEYFFKILGRSIPL